METTMHREITQEIFSNWQKKLDLLAHIIDVPAALIMRVHPEEIEVFVTSSTPGNPYMKGAREELNIGLYCETVMESKAMLNVANALEEEEWKENPDIKLGMISYLGLPLLYPDDSLFGTICVLDSKSREFTELNKETMNHFRSCIETDLAKLQSASKEKV